MAQVKKVEDKSKYYPVELTLTAQEAEFLTRLLGCHIVGSGDGWRGVSNTIAIALAEEFGENTPYDLPIKYLDEDVIHLADTLD